MAAIHIYTADGEQAVYSEERIAEMLKAGEVTPEVLYWRQGMSDWEPLARFQPSAARATAKVPPRRTQQLPSFPGHTPVYESGDAPYSTGMLPDASASLRREPGREKVSCPSGRHRYRFRRNPQPLTAIVQLMLVVCSIVAALELVNGLSDYRRIASTPPGTGLMDAIDVSWNGHVSSNGTVPVQPATSPAAQQILARGNQLQWIGWAANTLLALPYFFWLYRTSMNCRYFSSIMRFRPEWAVGSYFVPLINFFWPCQTMQEIWRVSANPRTWHNDPRSALVIIWWILTVLTVLLACESLGAALSMQTRDDQLIAAMMFLVLKGVQLSWYAFFFVLVTLIIRRQRQVVERSRRRAESEPAP